MTVVQTQRAVSTTPASQLPRERAERRLSTGLRVVAGVLFVATLVYVVAPVTGVADDFFREPPFVAGSVMKVALLGLACLYAAGDVRRRRGLVVAVIAAHVVLVVAVGLMLAFADTGREFEFGMTLGTVLLGALGFDAAIAVVLGVLLWLARLPDEPVETGSLTATERRLRVAMIAFTVLFGVAAAAFSIGTILEPDFFRELPLVANTVVNATLLALLCGYVAAAPRRNLSILGPIVAVHVLAVLAGALHLIALDTGYTRPLLGGDVSMTAVVWVALAVNAAIAVVFFALAQRAWEARFQPAFFAPMQRRALVAVGDVLVAGREERVPPEDIARNVDRHLAELRARRRWLYQVVLAAMQLRPMLELLPPLADIEAGKRREFLETRFRTPPRWPPFLKRLTQVMIRICQQLSFVGYYGDPRSYESIGYEPFSQRERVKDLDVPEPGPHPLKVDRPEDVGVKEIRTDICVIGSGAGGAILAYELAKRHPDREVLVLERGRYVEPREFNEDEVGMIVKLYADGLMQQTEDWRFTVLQGSCVGGSTTVNNAVCFDPPAAVLARWNSEFAAGLDIPELRRSVKAVRQFLRVAPQTDAVLNPSGSRYLEGAEKLPDVAAGVVEANIKDCFGSGYCNIGCKWGRKLSMLDTVLPAAQREFGERVRIISDCEVEQIVTVNAPSTKRVACLQAKLADGRDLTVRARTYVVAAGAVASSYLLLRSRAGRTLPVGVGFSCNMGAPLTADFEGEPLRSYDGLQISHFGIPRKDEGFVFETWFNPPVSQALNLPGWFEQHFANMERYDHLMAVGVLVGTERNGRIVRALTGGPGVDFRPVPSDLATLARGLRTLGELLFEAGASRVMLNSWDYEEFTSPRELSRIDEIAADPDYISLGTGHPQGGNAISRDPRLGVVGPDFRVHGYEDLHICDASVFPTSLTVNPQLTIMALAHYAAGRIAV